MLVVRFAGFGGQGLLTSALILADASAIYDKQKVLQTKSYRADDRGRARRSAGVVSDDGPNFPDPDHLDRTGSLHQLSVDKYTAALGEDGTLLGDATYVKTVAFGDNYLIPFTAIAREQLGMELVANVIALGALVELRRVVSKSGAAKALEHRVPQAAVDKNLQALELGYNAAREAAAARSQAEANYDIV